MKIPDRARTALWIAGPASGSLLAWLLFEAVGHELLHSYRLDLGSQWLPNAHETYFVALYAFFGVVSAGLLALAVLRLASRAPGVAAALRLFPATQDAAWMAFVGLAAFLIPLAVRMLALDGASVADDESCYRFGAQLFASGRLAVPSPPMKLFFDRTFMINDGRLYPMYFIGWPLLMAPGVKLGVGEYMNAVYAALTVPALFLATRRLAGSTAARACVLFFVASPMLMIGAATEMSNTTCFAASAWCLYCCLEARQAKDDATSALWPHVGVGLFFGVATLIRPPSALGVGAPVLVAWLDGVLRGGKEARARRIVAFAIPAAATATLFFVTNERLNGSPLTIGYIREFQYAKENGLRFNNWGAPGMRERAAGWEPHFRVFAKPWVVLANAAIALYRIDFNLYGFVPSLLFLPFAARERGARLLFAMVVSYFVFQYGIDAPGIDMYGPHHYVEVTLPMVVLTPLGVLASARWLRDRAAGAGLELLPPAFAAAMVVLSLVSYDPPRVEALLALAKDVNFARDAAAAMPLHHAVVFSPRPFTAHFAQCGDGYGQHFVYWRPNNDPDLKNDVLWVNHITLEEDAQLMAQVFPDRAAYEYFFDPQCHRHIVPLGEIPPHGISDGDVDGDNRGIVGARRR